MSFILLIIIYMVYMSLGLPNAILGASWPLMHIDVGADVLLVGVLGMVAFGGRIVSSLLSSRLIKRFGTGPIVAITVGMAAVGLFGFALSDTYFMLCVWSVVLGLGSGLLDVTINNFAALHYSSRNMSWMHCFFGVGSAAGPYVISLFLTLGYTWRAGYNANGFYQVALLIALILSLNMFKQKSGEIEEKTDTQESVGIIKAIGITGVKAAMLAFFSYGALENVTGLWASSYMVYQKGIDAELAAKWASLYYIGITAGRFLSGTIANRLGNRNMVRLGQVLVIIGVVLFILPLGNYYAFAALILIGMGASPVFPSLVHETPKNFGAHNSRTVISIQLASAYLGGTLMPTLFSAVAKVFGMGSMPYYMAFFAVIMILMTERLNRSSKLNSVC